ncbi:MAG TPA: MauE/DoxX family redox-associated membrane protein [Steroidobacteraceae bacterium]|nr:MauE/DoxX family redox-associated membrane protein [Steroidobacteraceae bacterium]
MLDPAVGYLIDLGGAVLFAGAAGHKTRRFGEFVESFAAYRVVPARWAGAAAHAIPILELAVCAALLLPAEHARGALAASGLLIAYAAAIALNLARGRRELDCGCAGPGRRRPIAAWMVWRNLILALVLGIAASPWTARALEEVDYLTVAGGLTAVVLLYLAVDRLAADVAPKGIAVRGAA